MKSKTTKKPQKSITARKYTNETEAQRAHRAGPKRKTVRCRKCLSKTGTTGRKGTKKVAVLKKAA